MRVPHPIIAIIGFLFVSALIVATPADVRIDSLVVHAINPPLMAVDDNYTIHGYARLFPLSNDSGYASYRVVTQPTHGTLSPATSSTPWYYPQAYFTGTDFFTYEILRLGRGLRHCNR